MFLNQIIDSREDMLHRYYNALYRKMFDLEIKNTSKQKYFLNLLFNSINKDDAIPRIKVLARSYGRFEVGAPLRSTLC